MMLYDLEKAFDNIEYSVFLDHVIPVRCECTNVVRLVKAGTRAQLTEFVLVDMVVSCLTLLRSREESDKDLYYLPLCFWWP